MPVSEIEEEKAAAGRLTHWDEQIGQTATLVNSLTATFLVCVLIICDEE